MIIDCDTCPVRGDACADCAMSVLLGPPPEMELDAEHRRAIDVLAEAGMVDHRQRLRALPLTVVDESSPGHQRAG